VVAVGARARPTATGIEPLARTEMINMGAYDSPGFIDRLPGGSSGPWNTGAEGTEPGTPPEATGQAVTVTSPGGRPPASVDVDAYDVITPNQEALYRPGYGMEKISGAEGIGETGAGQGKVWAPRAADKQ
jgi:hypothetical protein